MDRLRTRIAGLSVATFACWACGPTQSPQTQGTDPGDQATPADPDAAAVEDPAGVPGWMTLADGQSHPDMAAMAPVGFHVAGHIFDDGFVPEGDVLGEGTLAVEGHPGWLELRDGTFYGDESARSPTPPYVTGFRNAEGVFEPGTRTITY